MFPPDIVTIVFGQKAKLGSSHNQLKKWLPVCLEPGAQTHQTTPLPSELARIHVSTAVTTLFIYYKLIVHALEHNIAR